MGAFPASHVWLPEGTDTGYRWRLRFAVTGAALDHAELRAGNQNEHSTEMGLAQKWYMKWHMNGFTICFCQTIFYIFSGIKFYLTGNVHQQACECLLHQGLHDYMGIFVILPSQFWCNFTHVFLVFIPSYTHCCWKHRKPYHVVRLTPDDGDVNCFESRVCWLSFPMQLITILCIWYQMLRIRSKK